MARTKDSMTRGRHPEDARRGRGRDQEFEYQYEYEYEYEDRDQPDYEDASPEEIEADIRRTRAEMDKTIDALQQRIHPRELWSDLVSMFRSKSKSKKSSGDGSQAASTAKKVGRKTLEMVRDHPVPAVLLTTAVTTLIYETATRRGRPRHRLIHQQEPTMHSGSYVHAQTGRPYYQSSEHLGQGRLPYEQAEHSGSSSDEPGMMKRAGEGAREVGSQVGEKMSQAGHQVREQAGQMGEKMSQVGHSMREGVSHMGEKMSDAGSRVREGASQVGEQMRQSMQQTREFIEERPITVGIGALALGLLAGLLIPGTRREEQMMGEQAEHAMQRGKEMGREMYQRGAKVAEEAVEAATEAASHESERQGLKPE